MSRETYIPTEQPRSQTPSRLPFADGHKERPKSSCTPPRKGPQASVRITQELASADEIVKSLRLKSRRQFLRVANGHTERRRHVVVQARMRDDDQCHIGIGFTATKKVGNAVIRNRSKRRLREAARSLIPNLGWRGSDYVFIARQSTSTIEWRSLLDDVESALISLRSKLESGVAPEPRQPRGKRPGARKKKSNRPAEGSDNSSGQSGGT